MDNDPPPRLNFSILANILNNETAEQTIRDGGSNREQEKVGTLPFNEQRTPMNEVEIVAADAPAEAEAEADEVVDDISAEVREKMKIRLDDPQWNKIMEILPPMHGRARNKESIEIQKKNARLVLEALLLWLRTEKMDFKQIPKLYGKYQYIINLRNTWQTTKSVVGGKGTIWNDVVLCLEELGVKDWEGDLPPVVKRGGARKKRSLEYTEEADTLSETPSDG